MFDLKPAMLYLLTKTNFEEDRYLFKKKTNEKKKNHINKTERKLELLFTTITLTLNNYITVSRYQSGSQTPGLNVTNYISL